MKQKNIILPPINKKPCSWWKTDKKHLYKHDQFLTGVNFKKPDWEDYIYRLYNHIKKGFKLSERSKLFKELSKRIVYILLDKHSEEYIEALKKISGVSIYQKGKDNIIKTLA